MEKQIEVGTLSTVVTRLKGSVSNVFVGKEEAIHTLLIGFISGLHVLIEDIPGVGKTTLARCLAKSAGLDFGRIQFTPDILPGDILGMTVWSQEKRDFVFKKGAIMHQFILADEINRASPRTQSSLLEAMQENAITVDDQTYSLPQPFFVLATQNPVSFAGTFHLPEAEADRFGISLSIGYPNHSDEANILERFRIKSPEELIEPVTTGEEILKIREQVHNVFADAKIIDYMVKIAKASRTSKYVKLGMSPRATQHLLLASQTEAMFQGRDFIIPEDVQIIAKPVLKHRIILSAEARMQKMDPVNVIDSILSNVTAPSGLS